MPRIKNWERDDKCSNKFDTIEFDKCWTNSKTDEIVCITKRRSYGFDAIAFYFHEEEVVRKTICGCSRKNEISSLTVEKLRQNPEGFFDF